MADRIQQRGDTAANWASVNPTLADREIGWEEDTTKHKIGDGATAWNSLKYADEAEVKNHIMNGNMEIAQRGTVFGASTTVTTTNGNATLTSVASLTGIYVGMGIVAAGVTAGTTVTAIASSTSITMSANATASATVTAKFNALSGLYHLDRWKTNITVDGGVHPNVIISQVALTTGDIYGKYYYLQDSFDGAGSALGNNSTYGKATIIENGVRNLCGLNKQITFSIWLYSSIAGKKFGVGFYVSYGSGGSPSSGEVIQGSSVTLTTGWVKYTWTVTTNTLVGKTFGTNNDDGLWVILFEQWGSTRGTTYGLGSAEALASGTISMTGAELVEGGVARKVIFKTRSKELRDCQRYYEKSYTYSTIAGTSTVVGRRIITTGINTTATGYVIMTVPLRVTKRIIPTISYWDMVGNASKITTYTYDTTSTDNVACNIPPTNISDNSFMVGHGANGFAGFALHYATDAEL